MKRTVKRLWWPILLLGVLVMPAAGEDTIDGFVARTYQNRVGQTMPYRLFIPPGYTNSKTYPVVLWLHGAGGIGDDNLKQIIDDQVPGTRIWTKPENVAKHPAFVVVPQSPNGWAISNANLPLVLGILDQVRTEFRIDAHRQYVVGQSNGGVAAWGLITTQPFTFAAAVFVCSAGASNESTPAVSQIPIWAFVGTADLLFPATQRIVRAVRQAGGHPRYTAYPGAGHEIWDKVFKEPELVEWLFAQHN
jgi:predicted peptidase